MHSARRASGQELNRVVDWFDKNNSNCDWIVKTAASRGTQNRFWSRKSEITGTKCTMASEEESDFSRSF